MREKIENLFRKYNVKGVSCDSRNIRPDDAFFAIRGETIDGNQFINEALQIAKIVFTEDASRKEEEVFYISGGMLEVQPYIVSVLADTAIRANDIDEAAALSAKYLSILSATFSRIFR